MTEGKPIFRDDRINQTLNAAYRSLKEGLFAEAAGLLEKALEIDLEHPGLASALKCAGYWREREGVESLFAADMYGKGEQFLAQWKDFQVFAGRLGDVPEECMTALKQHVFQAALRHYLRLAEMEPGGDPEVALRIGRCYKCIGNYEQAIEFLEKANREKREDAGQLAELADCYSMVNETRAAKAFFREAFFIDPQAVDLSELESPVIHRLVGVLRGMGYDGAELNEWLPVYATVYGVFNVRREMKPLEFGKLKQSIFLLQKEIESEPRARGLVPRLINRYFWLIDHYMTAGESRGKIEEILARIKDLDPRVYREYAI